MPKHYTWGMQITTYSYQYMPEKSQELVVETDVELMNPQTIN